MKLIKTVTISAPDNSNHPPDVVPIPPQMFTVTLDYEQHKHLMLMFTDPPSFVDDYHPSPRPPTSE